MDVAKNEWLNSENKNDEFIYHSATDVEGKGFIKQFSNPNFVKEKVAPEQPTLSTEKPKKIAKKKSKMSALFK